MIKKYFIIVLISDKLEYMKLEKVEKNFFKYFFSNNNKIFLILVYI